MKAAFFGAWVRWIASHRWATIGVVMLLTGFAIFGQMNSPVVMDNSPEAFVGEDTETRRALNLFRQEFGHDSLFLVLVEGDVFSLDFLEKLKQLHRRLESLNVELRDPMDADTQDAEDTDTDLDSFADADGGTAWGEESGGSIFTEIISLVNVRDTSYGEQGLKVNDLLDEWPSESELPALKQISLEGFFKLILPQTLTSKTTPSSILKSKR